MAPGQLRAIALAMFRLLGLLLTGLFSFALGLILIDLIGWRWSPSSNLLDGFSTGTVLPVTVLLAAVGMGLLSVLNQPGFIRTPALVADPGPVAETELHRNLYRATVGSRLLRRLHLATGLAVIALLADLARTGTDPEDDGGAMRLAVLLALTVIVGMVLFMGDPTRTSPRDETATSTADKLQRAAGIPAVLLATVAVLVEAALVSGVDDLRDPPDGVPPEALARLVRFDDVADSLMLLGLSVLGALAAITVLPLLVHHRRDKPTGDQTYFRPYAWGLTPYLISSLATFVAIGFSAAAATTVASTLEINADDPSGEDVKVGSTLMLDRVAYAWGLTVFLIVLMGIAVGIWYLATRKGFLESVDRQFWNENDDLGVASLPAGWRSRVARAMFVARLKNALPAIVITFVVVGIAISTVQGLETRGIGGDADTPAWGGIGWLSNPRGTTWSIFVINLGAWTLVAGAGAIVALSRGALKNSGLRRGINVVWDIFGFWPHVAHPFGPEPYSRWTVMELTNRIRYHLVRRPGAPSPAVVIGPHSQGSVITVAALLLLTQEERDRVALLTCGSQLRVDLPARVPRVLQPGAEQAAVRGAGRAMGEPVPHDGPVGGAGAVLEPHRVGVASPAAEGRGRRPTRRRTRGRADVTASVSAGTTGG